MERITKRLVNGDVTDFFGWSPCFSSAHILRKGFEKLAHFEDLQEQGRLIELPYEVGKELFWIDKNISPSEIKSMCFVSMIKEFYIGVKDLNLNEFIFSNKIFETEAEAQKALEATT